jgi:hypothetical protein
MKDGYEFYGGGQVRWVIRDLYGVA